jgi:hypothetical protein
MSLRNMLKRRLKRKLRIGAEGCAIGLVAALAIISGTAVIVRLIIGASIGHRVVFSCVFFTGLLIVMIYRFWHLQFAPHRSSCLETYGTVTELSTDDRKRALK